MLFAKLLLLFSLFMLLLFLPVLLDSYTVVTTSTVLTTTSLALICFLPKRVVGRLFRPGLQLRILGSDFVTELLAPIPEPEFHSQLSNRADR